MAIAIATQDQGEAQIGPHHCPELTRPDRAQLGRAQRRDVDRVGEVGQDQRRGQQHADVRAHRIERLGEVQPARRRGLRAERHNERVGRRFQQRAACRQREQGGEERPIGHDLARRVEEECPQCREQKPGENARLIAEALVDERRRQREQEVGAEVRELYERGFERAHLEDALESSHHRRGHVRRDAPGGEAAGEGDEQHHHALADQGPALRGVLGSGTLGCCAHGSPLEWIPAPAMPSKVRPPPGGTGPDSIPPPCPASTRSASLI